MKRLFLGWHKPLLEMTADFLIKNHTDPDGRLNLKNVTVVLPGGRACDRLEEILAMRAVRSKNKSWYPPEFLTLGSLPEKFYTKKKPIADDMVRCFAWMEAVRRLDTQDHLLRKQLFPDMPTSFEAWIALGRMLDRLHDELAAESLDFQDVAKVCHELNAVQEIPRWEAFARLQNLYANDDSTGYLDEHDLWDIQAARLYAVKKQEKRERDEIRTRLRHRMFYLVGLVDMNKLQKGILKNFDEFITILVFAPDDEPKLKERFDEFGCLRSEKWFGAPIEIDDNIIKIVLKPEHQADTVLREIASLGNDYSSGEIVVGVPDKQVVPFLQQRFAQAHLPARLVEGTSFKRTGVYRFLEVLLKFLRTNHFRDYAELIRHPDVEKYLRQKVNASKDRNFIKQLDVYYTDRFPVFVPEMWNDDSGRGGESFESLRQNREQIKTLLGISQRQSGQADDRRPFDGWLETLKTIFDRLYRDRRNDPQNNAAPGIVLQKIESLKLSLQGLPKQFSFAEALEVFMTQIESESIHSFKEAGAIDMIGWLETAMDDAPVALITGMNDGKVPSFANADQFLPDELRQKLGLMDNRRRAARDAYYLHVLLETRKQSGKVALIAGRRSMEDDSLLPSRFFFVSNNERKVSERVRRFFKEIRPEIPICLTSSIQPGYTDRHAFTFPKLPVPHEPIERISVTTIRNFKECPYRFYLNRFLEKTDDDATELNDAGFGTLVHEVLRRFGAPANPVRTSVSETEIARFLDTELDRYVLELYGKMPLSTVEIQIERAKQRLRAFAKWQAQWRDFGYEIIDVELNPENSASPIMLSGVQLRGQIDRIDRKGNEFVILDYKTGESGPEENHRKDGDWIGFQLPLYHYILRESGYAKPSDTIRLGYMTISKNVNQTREYLVEWDETEVQEGITEAERQIAKITSQDWPSVSPGPSPPYSDGFEFICHTAIRDNW